MTSILTLLEPLIRTLLDRHLAAAVEWFPHELVPYEVGTHHGDAPWCADDSPFGPAVRTALQFNLLTEDNLPCYDLALVMAGEQVLGFRMPGGALLGFRRRALRIAAAGIYDLRVARDEVLAFLARLDASAAPSAKLRATADEPAAAQGFPKAGPHRRSQHHDVLG